jgi:hypothetical protein
MNGLRFWWHSKWISPPSSKKTSCSFNTLKHCLRLGHFTVPWKEEKNQNCAQTRQIHKISPKITSDQPLVQWGKVFENVILRTIQKHTEERNLRNASQFGFRADHSTTFQRMRVVDHVTLNFNNNMSTAANVHGNREIFRHNLAPWPTIYIVRIRIFRQTSLS